MKILKAITYGAAALAILGCAIAAVSTAYKDLRLSLAVAAFTVAAAAILYEDLR